MPTKIRVFRFIKDVQHEPAAQMCGHRLGSILIATRDYGVSVNDRDSQISLVTGHGTSDEFRIGTEVEELSDMEARPHIRSHAMGKLLPEEQAAFEDDNTEEKPEYTEEEKREIEAQIRENHPEYAGVLDQMDETREKLQVVDKRRVGREPIQQLEGWSEFSPSSTPSQTPGMDFPTALKQVMKGNRVTRLEWENPEIWLVMLYWGAINPKTPAGKYLTIHHADGAMNPLYISDGDLFGDDWVIVV